MSEGGYKIRNQYFPHFLTFTVVGWVDIFTRKLCRDIIIDSFKYCQSSKGLIIHAYVIMSNHIHLIASAEENTTGLSDIIRDFKKHTSKQLIKNIVGNKKESRRKWMEIVFRFHGKYNSNNQQFQIWQQDNMPMVLLYPRFTRRKIGYIHLNPVVAGWVENEWEYLYSSARNYAEGYATLIDVTIIDFGSEEGFVFV